MSRAEVLDKAEKNLKELEQRSQLFWYQFQNTEKEIAHLDFLKAQLEENIRLLSSRNVVPMLLEYKKARDDLARTKVRLNMLLSDREKIVKTCAQLQDMINTAKEEYFLALKYLDGHVIYVEFGKKDGQDPNRTQDP